MEKTEIGQKKARFKLTFNIIWIELFRVSNASGDSCLIEAVFYSVKHRFVKGKLESYFE